MTARSFAERQAALAGWLGSGGPSDMTEGTLVVVPSITFPEVELRKIVGIQYYEERLLFLLLLLRSPDLRIVFASSIRVEEPIVDYYLGFVPPELEPGHRLYMLAMWDPHPRALIEKLLENDEAVERARHLSEGRSCLLTFNVTRHEARLAELLDVPLYGCAPELVPLGFKSGSRQVAREAGVPVLEGSEDIYSLPELESALIRLKADRPGLAQAVVKLNQGFSGQGNAIVDLAAVGIVTDLPTRFCASEETWSSYAPKIAAEGAIVEEHVRSDDMRSPSVQLRIAPDGTCEVVSTHDQILGDPDEQVYLGCRFPADESYRLAIQDLGMRVAKVLAAKGVIGPFGVDFLVVPGSEARDPEIYLVEINLRMGGTTHPFLMAKLVTEGVYDSSTGDLVADGRRKHYLATDNVKSEDLVGVLPEQVIRGIDAAGLSFDAATKTGVTLHLLGAVKKYGKVGFTCIADSGTEAAEMYQAALEVIMDLRA